MSGRHDKKLDDEQSAKLLLTGPIVIRGLGRSVKDALLPGKPSRHRAFVAESADDDVMAELVEPTPLQQMLAAGPTAPEAGPASRFADAPATQEPPVGDARVPSDHEVTHTQEADGPQEDRMDDRRVDDAPPEDDDASRPRADPDSSDALTPGADADVLNELPSEEIRSAEERVELVAETETLEEPESDDEFEPADEEPDLDAPTDEIESSAVAEEPVSPSAEELADSEARVESLSDAESASDGAHARRDRRTR